MFSWVGALVLVATNVISESAAVRSIDMKTIMLFAGSMALGDAMVKTGTGSVIADLIVNSLGASPSPIVVLVVIFVLGVFMTNFMSNTATCALLVPIGLSLASQLGFDPKAVLAAIVIASSLAYATPIGMPANTMQCSTLWFHHRRRNYEEQILCLLWYDGNTRFLSFGLRDNRLATL